MNIDYQTIDTVAGLRKIANAIEKERNIAVDIEADSMYHFKEKVCLVQLATKKRNIIIDPIQVKDLSPLMSSTARTTIFDLCIETSTLKSTIFLTLKQPADF